MKAQCPNEDIDAFTAHIYMLAGDEKQAYENYAKADINKLDKSGLNEFVRCSYFTGHFEDALRAAEAGIKLEPRNPTFNRLAMFSNYELKNYDAAKAYINKYFNETDSAKFSEYDHFYTALIYQALEDKANMYAQYDKALELVNDSSMIKRWAILKSVSDSYLKDQEFEKAIKYYEQFIDSKPDMSFDDHEGLATIYSKYGDAIPEKKLEMMNKAIALYRTLAEKYPIQEVYATYMRASLNNKLDDNMKNSLAKPDYLKLISLLSSKADRTKGEDTMLKTAYHYMMFNSYINKKVADAKDFADKILVIDPEYKPALEIKNLK
jgi:tetratricopeptide (TPR) repeat protein